MTTKMSPDSATDALNSLRPREEDLTEQWYIGRREQVLDRVLSTPDEAPISELEPIARPRVRWALVAAAAAAIVALGLFAQTLLPAGMLGAPTAAQAMDRLADTVPTATPAAGSFVQESLRVRTDGAEARTGTQWTSVDDAWTWSELSDGPATSYEIRQPEELYVDPAGLTGSPESVRNQLRGAVSDQPSAVSVDAAVMLACYNLLGDPRTKPEARATLLRTLGVLDGVKVVEGVDPVGRSATIVRMAAPDLPEYFPADSTVEIFFDPSNGNTNGFQTLNSSGVMVQERLITAREVVETLPRSIVDILGTDREPKSVQRG